MEKLTYRNQGYCDRLQRAESWIERARAIEDWEDHHGQFIFYWIALNALYGRDEASRRSEADDQTWFLNRVFDLDKEARAIPRAFDELKPKADRLLKDQFLVDPYWSEGLTARVKRIIESDFKKAQEAWVRGDRETYIGILFWRLSVLRNQIFHGCSTDRRSLNKTSLMPALDILEALVPQFLETLRLHGKNYDWPKIPYPRKGSPQHPGA